MRDTLKTALVSLDREVLLAGRPDLVHEVEEAWLKLQHVCDEIDAADAESSSTDKRVVEKSPHTT
jgi:hypothetical protein